MTDSNHKLKPSPNLLEQKFHSQTPNTVWLANITSMTPPLGIMLRITLPGKGRRLALFGWHQRHGHAGGIVGWAMEDHMRAKLCCDALEMALGRRGPVPGLIHHSDRSSQYAGGDDRKLIKKTGLTQSKCRKGECVDNAPMESFFASLKKKYPS